MSENEWLLLRVNVNDKTTQSMFSCEQNTVTTCLPSAEITKPILQLLLYFLTFYYHFPH